MDAGTIQFRGTAINPGSSNSGLHAAGGCCDQGKDMRSQEKSLSANLGISDMLEKLIYKALNFPQIVSFIMMTLFQLSDLSKFESGRCNEKMSGNTLVIQSSSFITSSKSCCFHTSL